MAIKKAKADVEGNTLTLSFAHGEEVTISAGDLPNDMKSACLMHGLKQKVCDAYSGCKSPAEAMEKALEVVGALKEGNWTTRTPGEGGPRVTQIAKALAMVTGKPIEEAVEVVSTLSDEAKKNLGANDQIKVAIANIKAEEAKAAAEKAAAEPAGPSIADILSASTAEDDAA